MQPPAVVRSWSFEQLGKSILSVGYWVETISPQDARTYRDGGTGWTVVEVLAHLRDFEVVFMERAQVTLAQDFPDLPFPNPDQLAQERGYNAQDMHRVMEAWRKNRNDLLALLTGLTDEAIWQRSANHPRRGRMTLQDQLLLIPWHDVNHMEQMLRVMREKRTA